jgi:hypothetical protein
VNAIEAIEHMEQRRAQLANCYRDRMPRWNTDDEMALTVLLREVAQHSSLDLRDADRVVVSSAVGHQQDLRDGVAALPAEAGTIPAEGQRDAAGD